MIQLIHVIRSIDGAFLETFLLERVALGELRDELFLADVLVVPPCYQQEVVVGVEERRSMGGDGGGGDGGGS